MLRGAGRLLWGRSSNGNSSEWGPNWEILTQVASGGGFSLVEEMAASKTIP